MPFLEQVLVFNGVRPSFPFAVFSSRENAETWIRNRSLTGTLTLYPIDLGMYEYAIGKGLFRPQKDAHTESLFIGRFSGGGIDHFHYEDGARCGSGSAS